MRIRLSAIALSALAAFLPLGAQQTKTLTADRQNEYGVVYSLPVTALRVQLTARQTVKKQGPYAQYARKYLGTTDVVEYNSSQWQLVDAQVETFGVADAEAEQYLMQTKAGVPLSICVDPDGMLLAVNAEAELPDAQTDKPDEQLPGSSLDDNRYLQFVDEDFLVANSMAKKADMLARKIMEVRDARLSLTRGTAETMPTDGRQLELMLNSLAEQEKAMTEAFVGTTETRTIMRTYTLTPAADDFDCRLTLCRISDFDGIVPPADMAGDPVYITVSVTERKSLPLDEKGEPKRMPKDAVVYAVPGTAHVSVATLDGEVAAADVEMSQLGYRFGLDPKLFTDKKKPATATFSPVTGAIVTLTTP